jgi:hypothetical protein
MKWIGGSFNGLALQFSEGTLGVSLPLYLRPLELLMILILFNHKHCIRIHKIKIEILIFWQKNLKKKIKKNFYEDKL